MSDYYDRRGNPISLMDWAAMRESSVDAIRVAVYENDAVKVSTVWLGLDHSWGEGPPLIFETMIFGGERDGDHWRYSTEAEALAGHEAAVALVIPGGDDGDEVRS